MKKVLVIDVGGSHVKVHVSGEKEILKIPSGHRLTPRRMMNEVLRATKERGWTFDAVTLGVPAPVRKGKIALEPANLGRGWTRFSFARAVRHPVQVLNDAAMQALGSYRGRGTMLFLGLGTGLGSALVRGGVLVPLELARMPYRRGELEDYLGERALLKFGKGRWRRYVRDAARALGAAFVADEVVLGGGNARRLKELPELTRLGSNAFAIRGGERVWEDPGSAPPAGDSPREDGRAEPRPSQRRARSRAVAPTTLGRSRRYSTR